MEWGAGDGGKPRKTRHSRNCRASFAAAVTELRWKSTPLDRCIAATECGAEKRDTCESPYASSRGINQNPCMERRVATTDDIARGRPEATTSSHDREVDAARQRLDRSEKSECAGIRRVSGNKFSEVSNGKALTVISLIVMSRKGEVSVPSLVLAII